jgi:hypothetical protein
MGGSDLLQRSSAPPGGVAAAPDTDGKGGADGAPAVNSMTNGSADRGYGGSGSGAATSQSAERDSNKRSAMMDEVQPPPTSHVSAAVPPPTKKKNTDWPLRAIQEPHDNDVLFGRGGECFFV